MSRVLQLLLVLVVTCVTLSGAQRWGYRRRSRGRDYGGYYRGDRYSSYRSRFGNQRTGDQANDNWHCSTSGDSVECMTQLQGEDPRIATEEAFYICDGRHCRLACSESSSCTLEAGSTLRVGSTCDAVPLASGDTVNLCAYPRRSRGGGRGRWGRRGGRCSTDADCTGRLTGTPPEGFQTFCNSTRGKCDFLWPCFNEGVQCTVPSGFSAGTCGFDRARSYVCTNGQCTKSFSFVNSGTNTDTMTGGVDSGIVIVPVPGIP